MGLMFPKGEPGVIRRRQKRLDQEQAPFGKGEPHRKRINAVRSKRKSIDKAESDKVEARSEGRCEIVAPRMTSHGAFARCVRPATQVHHKMSGIGVRGRGASALAENKLHVCAQCHADIHARRLVPYGQFFRVAK